MTTSKCQAQMAGMPIFRPQRSLIYLVAGVFENFAKYDVMHRFFFGCFRGTLENCRIVEYCLESSVEPTDSIEITLSFETNRLIKESGEYINFRDGI